MLLQSIREQIESFILDHPQNVIADLGMMHIYDRPLIGVASADDLLWDKLKAPDVIGAHHLSPCEWLPEAKSVISFFLPFSERVRAANRTERTPALAWLYGRWEGELLNQALRRFVVELIENSGGQAMVPGFDPRFTTINLRSNWSERHVAFVSGLGTFSLNRSLITRAGSAGRLGSVVTTLDLQATPRAYEKHDEYCTRCGTCINRCPPRAISFDGKEHAPCQKFIDSVLIQHKPRYGCGKCQTAVPCEAGIPLPVEPAVDWAAPHR